MNVDDVVYVCLLLVAILLGPLIKKISNIKVKQIVSSVIGVGMLFAVSGIHFFHPVLVTIVNILLIFYVPKSRCHFVSFLFCFFYLGLLRSLHLIGIIDEPVPQQLNAIEMVHALKMVGLAFEIHDSFAKGIGKNKMSANEIKYSYVNPSFLDVVHYSFCYIGFLTGPYYKFRTYLDWLHRPYAKNSNLFPVVRQKIQLISLFIAIHLAIDYLLSLEYARQEIFSRSFIYRWVYMTPFFISFRLRLYAAFFLAECSCIAAGLGVYPEGSNPKPGRGPTNFDYIIDSDSKDSEALQSETYSSETVNGVNISKVESGSTLREAIKYWNMTVQYWFAMYVYKRVQKLRTATTLLMSAFWHGVRPGYYLCFLSVPFAMVAEESLSKLLRSRGYSQQFIYWICQVFKSQVFAYLGMAFFLLEIEDVLRYWRSLYFSGHILLLVVYVLGCFASPQQKHQQKTISAEAATVNSK